MYLKNEAQKALIWAIKHRRYLHQYPEIGLQEKNTSLYCQDVMQSLGYKVQKIWGYGFIADLDKEGATKKIAWRTELDALPIHEKNTHSFVSKISNVSHMCGHDMHMAVSFLAAKLIMSNKEKLPCSVRFIFQPSEEIPPGGARFMIENKCLEGVDEIYGFHNDVSIPIGTMRIKVGAITAETVMFDLVIKGKGTHAATPHLGLDPLFATAELVTSWQSIISRNINPTHSAAMSVTKFICGFTNNVIPEEALVAGTIRAFDKKDLVLIERFMEGYLKALQHHGYRYQFNYDRTYDMTINEKYGVDRVIKASSDILGEKNIYTDFNPPVCGEDFGYYLQQRKGAFFLLGVRNEEKKIIEPVHSSRFEVDEDAIALGAAIAATLMFSSF